MAVDASPTGQIQEFLTVLKRRRWQIILPALFVVTFGSAFAVIVPKKYVVETRVELKETRNPLDDEGKHRQDATATREVSNVNEHIIHARRIERIISKDLIGDWPEYQRADKTTQNEIIGKIMENLDVAIIEKTKSVGSTFVDITYKDVDPERAVAFLERVSTLWFDELREQSEAELETERDVLAESERNLAEKYREANVKWGELADEMRYNPALEPGTSDLDFIYEQLKKFQSDQQVNEVTLLNARSRLATLQEAYDLEPEEVRQVNVSEGESFAAEIAAAGQAIESLEVELASLTTRNSQYQKKLDLIAAIRERIEEFDARAQEATQIELMVPNATKDVLRLEVQAQRGVVVQLEDARDLLRDKVGEFTDKAGRRSNDYLLLQDLWTSREQALNNLAVASSALLHKEKAISLNKETAAGGLRIPMRPSAPSAPSEPSALLLVAFSVFAGLALGLAIALMFEYARNSYRSVSDLAGVMSVPVLGAIQAIVTGREARRQFMRRVVVGVSSAVILSGVASMVFVWSDSEMQSLLPVSVLQAIESLRLNLM